MKILPRVIAFHPIENMNIKYLDTIAYEFIGLFISLADIIVPKRKGMSAFVVGENKSFSGNIKASHDYFAAVSPVNTLLMAHSSSELSLCEPQYRESLVAVDSLQGLFLLLRCQNIFIEYWSGDWYWKGLLSSRHKVINLWHGVPIKKVGIAEKSTSAMRRESKKLKHMIASSHVDRAMMSSCFEVHYNDVLLTGYPRNDWIISDEWERISQPLAALKQLILSMKQGKRLVLYAPTFRGDHTLSGHESNGVYPFSTLELTKLKSLLASHNALLGIRPHINKVTDHRFVYDDVIIDLSKSVIPDVQLLLKYTDVLVSDYSGVWVDFLLVDRPIIGFVYDQDDYMKNRGYLYDFTEIFPGDLVLTFEEMLQRLTTLLTSETVTVSAHQERIKKMFHAFTDGRASERLFEHLNQDW